MAHWPPACIACRMVGKAWKAVYVLAIQGSPRYGAWLARTVRWSTACSSDYIDDMPKFLLE